MARPSMNRFAVGEIIGLFVRFASQIAGVQRDLEHAVHTSDRPHGCR
jgi:hypothetical protein